MKPTKPRYSRRDFLKTAGVAGAGAVLGADVGKAGAGETETPSKIPTRPFGKTGHNVSVLSLGGMFDIHNNQLLMRQAFRWGVTYWDTADCYQRGSERGIGKYFAKYPAHRKQVFLVSKSDSRDPDGMSRLLERSLERLNTDYLDLYFVHGIRRISEMRNTKKWSERAKADGKIRLFGFSTHSNMESCLLEAPKLGWIDGIMMTYNYRLMHTPRMTAAVDACIAAGIGLTAMKVQGGGQIRTSTETEMKMAGRFLKQGFTDGQAKLKAVWENPNIASICSQMPNMTYLISNVAAALNRSKLSQTDMDLLQRYASETTSEYCTGCTDICEGTLNHTAPIGDVMRCLMYKQSYGDMQLAQTLFRSLPAGSRERLSRLDFSAAERRCPQGLAIGNLVKEALETLA